MTRRITLLDLADCCEAATGPDDRLDASIEVAIQLHAYPDAAVVTIGERPAAAALRGSSGRGWRRYGLIFQRHFYTSSLDAAMRLLPDTEYDITNLYGVARAHVEMGNEYGGHHGTNECGSMPLAFCAAALRARHYAAGKGGDA